MQLSVYLLILAGAAHGAHLKSSTFLEAGVQSRENSTNVKEAPSRLSQVFHAVVAELRDVEADAEVGSDGRIISLAAQQRAQDKKFSSSYVGNNDGPEDLGAYCVGATDQEHYGSLRVGQKVMVNWEQYGAHYPGKIVKTYADGTFKVHYDDGFSEDHVSPSQIRQMTAEERKKNSKGSRNDPACKFQNLIKDVQPRVKKLESQMSEWCMSQRAKLGNGKLPPPPKSLTAGMIAPLEHQPLHSPIVAGAPAEAIDLGSPDGKGGKAGAGSGKDLPSGLAAPAPAAASGDGGAGGAGSPGDAASGDHRRAAAIEAPPASELPKSVTMNLDALKAKIDENDAYIDELKKQEADNAVALQKLADPDIKTPPPGVKTVDDLIAEYKDRIAAQEEEIERRLARIRAQQMELARLGARQVPLSKIEAELSDIEKASQAASVEMLALKRKGELDPDLEQILDGILKPISNIRERLDELSVLQKKAEADKKKLDKVTEAAAEEARQKAKQEGKSSEEADREAEVAAVAAEEEHGDAVKDMELETLAEAQEVHADFEKSSDEANELDYGLHPHGEKWWRYRYEHSYIEAWMMIFISLLMLFWRKVVQDLRYTLEEWALPYGASMKTEIEIDLGYSPGRDDGSLWMVWFSCLTEMMLTCILVFISVWAIAKTSLFDYVPFLVVGDESLHVPSSGNQYRRLAIDLSSIYFFAILFYFGLMSFVAHHAKIFNHHLTREFTISPRSPRTDSVFGNAATTAATAVMGAGMAEYQRGQEWFGKYMPHDIKGRLQKDSGNVEAKELKDMYGKDWSSFPLAKYLIMNVHVNMSAAFAFGWMLWMPIVVCFFIFTFLHRFEQMGYIRIMAFFSGLSFFLIVGIAYYTKGISEFFESDPEEIETKYHDSFHTTWCNTETVVLKTLQFTLFVVYYGVARMVCQTWMWELHFKAVLALTICAIVLSIMFVLLVSPALPSFCAVMAMPPYVNNRNLTFMLYASKHDYGDGTGSKSLSASQFAKAKN